MFKKLFLELNRTQSIQDRYNITDADDIEVLNLGANGSEIAIVVYKGSAAITTSKYQNFPAGTWFLDKQAKKIGVKVGAEGVDNIDWSAAFT